MKRPTKAQRKAIHSTQNYENKGSEPQTLVLTDEILLGLHCMAQHYRTLVLLNWYAQPPPYTTVACSFCEEPIFNGKRCGLNDRKFTKPLMDLLNMQMLGGDTKNKNMYEIFIQQLERKGLIKEGETTVGYSADGEPMYIKTPKETP